MRHAILGVGGVGGLIGAALAKSGDQVTLILRPEVLVNYPQQLSLESSLGSFSVPIERATEVRQPFDVLWVTVKATQLTAALLSIVVDKEALGAIVPLLNGIDHVAVLRAKFGHERVVPASIAVESERVAPGKIVHRSPGARLVVSSIGESRLAATMEQLRQFGFTCQFNADEQKLLWSKLAFLAPYALVTTASGLTAGGVKQDPVWRKRIETCIHEACAVSTASGTPLDADEFIQFLDKISAGMKSSMQKDVEAGNPPELDAIAGPILRGAGKYGLQVPVTQELVDQIEKHSTGASRH